MISKIYHYIVNGDKQQRLFGSAEMALKHELRLKLTELLKDKPLHFQNIMIETIIDKNDMIYGVLENFHKQMRGIK